MRHQDTALEVVLAEVAAILVAIVGEDYTSGLDIGMDTSFNDDLQLESLEYVTLTERLQRRYGSRVDLAAFIAGKDIDEMIRLTLGDVVAHIAERLADG